MIVQCAKCDWWFDDEFRNTDCPHSAFPANDGHNNFHVYEEAYRSPDAPTTSRFAKVTERGSIYYSYALGIDDDA